MCLHEIPFMPIQFFKTQHVGRPGMDEKNYFQSSGTTGTQPSKHYFANLDLYRHSVLKGFELRFGNIADYTIFGLLPPPTERPNSSLLKMYEIWSSMGKAGSGKFYLNDFSMLASEISQTEGKKLIIGLAWALLDWAEAHPINLSGAIIIETGGMKGQRPEIPREQLHHKLKTLCHAEIVSEYGMTELFSQAYTAADGKFAPPPWMKVMIREANDPLDWAPPMRAGGVNIIDLANADSCSFIATDDLGRQYEEESFDILGRLDFTDMRGCSLMYN